MDPDACLSDLLDALADSESQEAQYHADDLLSWLDRGGFSPGGGKLRLPTIRAFCDWVKTKYPEED